MADKHYVGEPVTLNYMWTGARTPWHIKSISKAGVITLRRATEVYHRPHYWCDLPDAILDNPYGEEQKIRYNKRRKTWLTSPAGRYPWYATFGRAEYAPHMD